jgi:hypothetical protein
MEGDRFAERHVDVPTPARAFIDDDPPSGGPDQLGDRRGVPPDRFQPALGGV